MEVDVNFRLSIFVFKTAMHKIVQVCTKNVNRGQYDRQFR